MLVNTMYVFYSADRLPYKDRERSVHYPIVGNSFVGASNTTKIRFYIDRIGESDATWVSIAKLPNGKMGSQLLSVYHDDEIDEWYAEMNLTNFYTQYKGDVYIALNGYTSGSITYNEETGLFETDGSPVIEATGSIKLAINYAPQYVGGDIEDGVTLEDVLSMLGTKLNKNSSHYVKKVSAIADINNDTYTDYLVSGDIVYSVSEENLYKLSGTHPTLVATLIEHGLVIPTSATFPYSLTDNELAKLSHNDSFIVYGNEILSINSKSSTIINLDNIEFTSIGSGEYVINKVYANVDVENKEIINISALTEHFYSTDKIDSLLETIRGNEFTLVDIVQYPTLQSFLNSTGNEGVVYLYPVGDVQNNYYKYIWESNSWVSLGTTEFDFSQYYNKTEIDDMLSAKENVANKVTSLSVLSTDTQYPTAKAVYDNLQEVREVAEGKCATYVLSNTATSITTPRDYYTMDGRTLTREEAIEYVEGYTNINGSFALNDDTIGTSVGGNLYILLENATIIKFPDDNSYFKVGDIFLVTQTDVPDRWARISGNVYLFYKLETSKIDLTGFYKKNEDIIPAFGGLKIGEFTQGSFQTTYTYTISKYAGTSSDYLFRYAQSANRWELGKNLIPDTTNTYDIGSSTNKFKDAYLSGKVNLDNDIFISSNSSNGFIISSNGYSIFEIYDLYTVANNLRPRNSTTNIGSTANRWKDIWFSGNLKGGATMTQAQYDALVSGGTVDSDTFYFIEEE